MSTFCHTLQDVLDTHKAAMPDAVYLELIERIGDEAQRGLKMVSFVVTRHTKDGMSTDKFTIVCRPMSRPYCASYLLKRGEYDPKWLEAEMPLIDSLEDCTYIVHNIEDLEVMPKRRRTEAPVVPPPPTPMSDVEPETTVDLSRARIFGSEWDEWRETVLASNEAAEIRSEFADESDAGYIDDRVTDRLSAFCEACMKNYVPGKGYVLGFHGGLAIDCVRNGTVAGVRCSMVCLECLPADHPAPSWTD